MLKLINSLYLSLFSETAKKKNELIIISIAVVSFIVHLLLIAANSFIFFDLKTDPDLLSGSISAIYTPFSFILLYEVYLLVYYLPTSTSIYIGKQYEIITLIVIRRVFKDISQLEFSSNWFFIKKNIQFTYDIIAAVLLFYLILIFYKLNKRRTEKQEISKERNLAIVRFVRLKSNIAVGLFFVFGLLTVYSLGKWVYESYFSVSQIAGTVPDVNKIFFDDFFTVLILTDVLLLLISFLYTNKFSKVIRNSGFIISTILLKLSFSTQGLLNTALIVGAVLFGVVVLAIHNEYEKLYSNESVSQGGS